MLERKVASRDAAAETRERLLDTAERLFAEDGIGRTSLRAITLAAGVNVAAIHYHFGSKEALLQAVFARRLEPVNRERLARLERIETAHSDSDPLPLEPLLEAFLAPLVELPREPDGASLTVLFGRLLTEPEELIAELMREQFREVVDRFSAALERAGLGLSRPEILWRLHCSIGVMGHVLTSTRSAEVAHELGLPEQDRDRELLRRVMLFCAAGFRTGPERTAP